LQTTYRLGSLAGYRAYAITIVVHYIAQPKPHFVLFRVDDPAQLPCEFLDFPKIFFFRQPLA
jgi:hypothetical protein